MNKEINENEKLNEEVIVEHTIESSEELVIEPTVEANEEIIEEAHGDSSQTTYEVGE